MCQKGLVGLVLVWVPVLEQDQVLAQEQVVGLVLGLVEQGPGLGQVAQVQALGLVV